jgi:hypothetical protein
LRRSGIGRGAAALAAAFALGLPAAAHAALPPLKHVFVIVLENKDYNESFGKDSAAPYLAQTLPAMGKLLTQYFGTSHLSLGNYLTMISGQAPNFDTQGDCMAGFRDIFPATDAADGQVMGTGCVYPAKVKTIADQLEAKGMGWKGYFEDMDHASMDASQSSDAPQNAAACRHPSVNMRDDTQSAEPSDGYAARHNPFVYFHSIIDNQALCDAHVLPLSRLQADLASAATTPAFAMIVPNLCNDAHDTGCPDTPNNLGPVKDGKKVGGLAAADAWLRAWIPILMASPAYTDDGAILVTYDEAEQGTPNACCDQPTGPNTPKPGITGAGGGRTGTLVLSPWTQPGSHADTPYNHYSLLRTVEELFGFAPLGYAAKAKAFGADVFDRDPNAAAATPAVPEAPPANPDAVTDSPHTAKPSTCSRPKLAHGGRGRQPAGTLLGAIAVARRPGHAILVIDVLRYSRVRVSVHEGRRVVKLAPRPLRGCRTHRIPLPRGARRPIRVTAQSGHAVERRTLRG